MTVKAGILARVSTDGQKDNSSHDSQLERCRTYCADKGYTVVLEKREVMSGSFVLARSDFNALLQADLNVIVVDIPDRLGRGDVIAQCEMLARLNNKRVEYAQPGRDTTTLEGYIQHSAEQMVSGIERHNIKRRTAGGKIAWAERGRVIAPPRRPYGYRIEREYDAHGRKTGCTFLIDPAEAKIVQQIFEWCALQDMTTSDIARALADGQVPRLSDYDPDYQSKSRSAERDVWHVWPRSTIAALLRNPLYKGEWKFGRRTTQQLDTPAGVKRTSIFDAAAGVAIPVPAIVEGPLWELAQQQLDKHLSPKTGKFVRPTSLVFLLRGRVRCALCGHKYYCNTGYKYQRHYYCSANDYGYDSTGQTTCAARTCRAEVLEGPVWQVIREELQRTDHILLGAREREAELAQSRQVLELALAALVKLNERDQAKLARLLDLYVGGHLSKEQYLAKQTQVQAELTDRDQARLELQAQLQVLPVVPPEFEQVLAQFQRDIAEQLDGDVPLERQRQLIELLDVTCVYDAVKGELTIKGIFGDRILYTASSC